MLIEERPNAVAKEALIERLWPEQFVVEANLASLVAELRRKLGSMWLTYRCLPLTEETKTAHTRAPGDV